MLFIRCRMSLTLNIYTIWAVGVAQLGSGCLWHETLDQQFLLLIDCLLLTVEKSKIMLKARNGPFLNSLDKQPNVQSHLVPTLDHSSLILNIISRGKKFYNIGPSSSSLNVFGCRSCLTNFWLFPPPSTASSLSSSSWFIVMSIISLSLLSI